MNAATDRVPELPLVPQAEPGSAGSPCAYAALRAERPISRVRLPTGEPVWLVSRYADVREALAHPRLVRPVIATWPPQDAEPWPRKVLTLLELRGDVHKRVRGAVAPAFTPRRLEALAPRIRAVADELVDELLREGPPGDLVEGFTEPFPLRVLCEFLGVDPAECAAFTEHTETVLDATRVPLERTLRALDALRDFAADLVDECRRGGGSGLLGQLARAARDEGGLDRDDLISVTISMLIAGYKTNVQHFGSALPTLLERPRLLSRLRLHPDLIPDAVEELLRHVPLMNAIVVLVATGDLELGGRHIREGEAVMPVIASANRDAETFGRADEFDPERSPNPHLAFGRGPHYCPGGHLTRMQLRIALETLLARLPGLRPDTAVDRLEWDEDAPLRAPLRLPVRWDRCSSGSRGPGGVRP
ncbi:cytochrome P450 [Nocardiopsis ganjiahuensis]|uniref:cytochrome P450 n=1 Tax=Nocardiopsis ganjiahuensis TaxID=239984 RepID=UPI000348A505|nr:cytochrome P450 [Nocardiopsis ganjiahuensis]